MKLINYISAATLMLSISACSNENDLTASFYDDADAVKINATVGEGTPFTRSNPIGTTEEQARFNTGDQIAVQAGTQAAVTYQYDGTTWAPATTGAYLKWASNPMDFTAYYPANKNGASMEAFTLPADQSTLEKLADADYMTCAATSVAKAPTVSLSLTRKTARIVISSITFNDQFKEGYTVSEIKVTGNSTGYVGGTVQTGSTQVTSYNSSTDRKFYALLTPTTADATATFLTLTVTKTDGSSPTTLLVKGIPATVAGMSYDYTLAVGKDLVQVGNVSVENWETGAVISGGEAEEVIPDYKTYNEKGAGTEADPYQIWNKAQLKDLATQNNATASIDENTYFKLLHDIDLSGEEWTPIGTNEQRFKGHFDGNGHSVKGITITQDIQHAGLFGYTEAGSSIKDLSAAGSIKNESTANTRFAGGLVGYNKGTITACSSIVTVTADGADAQAGGLVGYNNNDAIITACHATGTVTATGARAMAGGLVGNNGYCILACYSTGAVKATGTSAKVGGLAGNNQGYIYACYATGEVAAAGTSANVGSLVGYTNNEIWYCLTTGSIGTADANRVLSGITVNGEITGVGTVSREKLATHCHGGDGIKNTLNTEGATGFGMLNDGLSQIKDKLGIDCPPYHYVAGDNDIPVLAPGAP